MKENPKCVRKSDSQFPSSLLKTAAKTRSDASFNLTKECVSAMVAYTQQLAAGLVLSLSCLTSAYGQPPPTNITPTTGVGDLGTTVTQVDNVRDITDGTRPGGGPNLFHSFENFSIGEGDVANFLNDSGLATDNILSRVTGGTQSDIFGTLRTTGFRGAQLFLLNRAGIWFGPNARLNVEGAFHASTADYLRFQDGTRFNVSPNPAGDVLSVAPVAAFGFLEPNPEKLSIEGSQLSVPKGETLTVVSGDMDIGEGARLTAPEGRVNLVSVGSAGEVIVDESGVDVSAVDTLGEVSLTKANVEAGQILIRGGRLQVGDAAVLASGDAPEISVEVQGEVAVTGRGQLAVKNVAGSNAEGLSISPDSAAVAGQGRIELVAGADIHLERESSIHADGPQGGDVRIESDAGTTWVSGSVTARGVEANGGEVRLLGERVALTGDARVDVSGETGGGVAKIGGDYKGAGSVKNALRTYVGPDATIQADAGAQGDGGTVIVWAEEGTRFEGTVSAHGGTQSGSGGFAEVSGRQQLSFQGKVDLGASNGEAGTLLLDPNDLVVADGGDNDLIGTGNTDAQVFEFDETDDAGNDPSMIDADAVTNALISSDVELQANNTITVNEEIRSTVSSNDLTLRANDEINISEPIVLPGSDIDLVADQITLAPGGSIDTSADGISTQAAGAVSVVAKNFSMNASSVTAATGQELGGNIEITARSMDMSQGALLQTSTKSEIARLDGCLDDCNAKAGDVIVNIEDLDMNDSSIVSEAVLDRDGNDYGPTGSLTIRGFAAADTFARKVNLENNSELITEAKGGITEFIRGKADDITVNALDVELAGSTIRSQSGVASQGKIMILGAERILSNGGNRIASLSFISADGNVKIQLSSDSEITLSGGDRVESIGRIGELGAARAGDILISAPTVTMVGSASDKVQVTSEANTFGTGGNLRIDADTLVAENTIISVKNPASEGPFTGSAGRIIIKGLGGGDVPARAVLLTGSELVSNVTDFGNGGPITLRAAEVVLDNTTILTATGGVGAAGAVTINADKLIVTNDAEISSSSEGNGFFGGDGGFIGAGRAGNLTIQGSGGDLASNVEFDQGASLLSEAFEGTAGSIQIKAQQLTLEGATISTTVSGETPGDRGGDVTLTAEMVTMEGSSRVEAETTGGADAAGTVTLNVGTLGVREGARISTSTAGAGEGGAIVVQGFGGEGTEVEVVDISGQGATFVPISSAGISGSEGFLPSGIFTTTGAVLEATEAGMVLRQTGGVKPGGSILVAAERLILTDRAEISAESFSSDGAPDTGELPNAGNIMLNIASLELLSGASISSSATTEIFTGSDPATGAAGQVTVQGLAGASTQAAKIVLTNGALLTTAEAGTSGNIEVSADEVALTNATISSSVLDGERGAGQVRVNASRLTMAASTVASETEGGGDAGSVFLSVGTLEAQDSQISSSSTAPSSGQPGSITILGLDVTGSRPADQVTFTNSEVLTQIEGEDGGRRPTDDQDVGQIQIIADTLSLNNTRISGTTAGIGDASEMRLWANEIELQGSEISSSTSAVGDIPGDAGLIFIRGAQQGVQPITSKFALVDSKIRTNTTGGGFGGIIQIDAVDVSLSEGSEISASTASVGSAGGIGFTVDNLSSQDSLIASVSTSAAPDAGAAGSIRLTAAESISIEKGSLTTVASGGAGGSIEVTAESLNLRDMSVLATVKDVPVGAEPDQGIADVSLVAPSLEIVGGIVDVQTLGTRNAGQVLVEADVVKINGTDVSSSSTPGAKGAAGGVVVQGHGGGAAQLVELTSGSSLTSTAVEGAAGGIEVSADEVALTNATISSSVFAGERDAGRVRVNASLLTMAGSTVASETEGAGDAGSISLNVVTLDAQDSRISSSSTAPGSGQPGSIGILGPVDQVTLTNSEVLTQILGESGGRRPNDAEDVGQIQIIADTLSLDGSRISGTTAGIGDASVMRLWANEFALQGSEISSSTSAVGDTPGDAGQIFIRGAKGVPSIASQLALVDSEIRTGTTGGGFGGEIQIDAVEVNLSEGSEISAGTASVGSAGDIGVRVGNLSSQDSLIASVSTSAAPDAGAAGSIRLTATDTISIDKGGLTTAANGGAGGSIDVTATNAIALAGTDVLATVLGGEQPGGDVTLSAPEIRLTNGTAIAAESEGTGTAGAIAVGDAGTNSLRLQSSTMSTNAAQAKGGDINVQAQEMVYLTDSAITTSVGAGEGQGGNIFIDPQYVILNASRVQANAVGGRGGRIEIISDIFIASADSVVEAVSETNIQGVILISAPERDVVSGASVLPAEFQDPSRRLRASCGQRMDVGRSNFREVGLEGLPPSPDDYLWVMPLLPVAKAGGELGSMVFFEPATTQFQVTPCGQY